jgi:hypothetical protein
LPTGVGSSSGPRGAGAAQAGTAAAAEPLATSSCLQPPGRSAAQIAWEQLHAEHDKKLTQKLPEQQGHVAQGSAPPPLQVGVREGDRGARSSSSCDTGSISGDSPRQGSASGSSPQSAQAKMRAAAARLMPRLLGARKQAEMLD